MIRLRLERRARPAGRWLQLALPFAAVGLTLVLCALLVRAAGAEVLPAYARLFLSTVESPFAVEQTLIKTAPLVLCGLAVAVAFRARFWNIGAEGQLLAGAVAGGFVAQRPWLPEALLVPGMLLAAALAGAAWAVLPALLRVRLKVDDVVSTLLLNYVILYAVMGLLRGPWKDPASAYPTSAPIRAEAELPVLLGGNLHTAAALSGGLAGLAGAGEVGGVHFQVNSEISAGYGYAGIAVAMLAELSPLGVLPAALFFAMALTGAEAMARATGVPVYLAQVIQGVALLAMVSLRLFATYRLRVERPAAEPAGG